MMQVGFEFGTLLGRIWVDFGSKLGRKLGQIGSQIDKNGVQDDIQKRSRNKEGCPPFWGDRPGPGAPWEGDLGGGKNGSMD